MSIIGRDIPGTSKNKSFWKSNIEAVYFIYVYQNGCKLELEPLRNRIFHKNFVIIITLDNASSNT